MKYILLWLEGPLQSWGNDSVFYQRDTLNFPTKSGVLGMLFAAAGWRGSQEERLKKLSMHKQWVWSYAKDKETKPVRLIDFHMVGSGYDDNDSWTTLCIPKTSEGKKVSGGSGGTKLTYRYYLQDARFGVIVEIPDEMADGLTAGLSMPVYDTCLGRKNCVPTDFVFRGIFETMEEAKISLDQCVHERNLQLVFSVSEIPSDEDEESFQIQDVPLVFGKCKQYASRTVFVNNGG